MNDGLDSGSVHERGYSDFMPGITASPVFVEVTEISTQAAIFKKNSGFKTPSFPGKVVNCLHGHPTVMGLTEESARGCLFQIWKRGAPKMAPRRLKQGRSQKGTTGQGSRGHQRPDIAPGAEGVRFYQARNSPTIKPNKAKKVCCNGRKQTQILKRSR